MRGNWTEEARDEREYGEDIQRERAKALAALPANASSGKEGAVPFQRLK